MKLPFRKCYHAAKVGLFLIIVITILALYEQWRGGKRTALAESYDNEDQYEKEILEDEARIIPGLGEGGVASRLVGLDKRLGEESEKKLAMNVYLSDRIAYNRTLKDFRDPACQRVVYDAELPSASVILIFHNEPYSVVIRTIWSVVNSARRDNPWFAKAHFRNKDGRTVKLGYPGQDPSSPYVYLKEIILVDDNSTLPELKGKLSHYVRTRLPPDLIRILRLPDRVGLTRARLAGARYAIGEVLVFLDSHCEGQQDWLRPILQRIGDFPHAVVVPIIDVIHFSTFFYSTQDPEVFQVQKSQGLILARISGARASRGDVLIFLDAHCEVGHDWLRPLLQRISHKRDTVLTPLIDVLDQTTFQLEAAQQFQVGGFNFAGHFTWIDVPEREKKRRGSSIAPTWSPTMAGGLFAINRQYYWELGAYDEQMNGWGGENLEISFRIWQCGGTLETVPCSRVGHVFRAFHPYGLPANTDTHGINTARMAEVWMDDYAELFYLNRPDLRKNPKVGDVTHRKILREKLKCKSFQWFLDNIYKEKFVPVRDVFGFGRFRNPASALCLDTLQRNEEPRALGLYPCHDRLEPTQHLALSLTGELRDEEKCAEVQYERSPLGANENRVRRVLTVECHGKQRGQHWRYLPTKQLQHTESRLCLQSTGITGTDVVVARCKNISSQVWVIDYSELNEFKMNGLEDDSEQERKLKKLRGQRRISRSLLSVSRRKSKKHRKNKFILKLVRNSSEHLEMDVYCKHRRLLPNDSFVRDLVTILNDKDIKVINNGRVFERHKVSDLVKNEDTPSTIAPDTPDFPDSPDTPDTRDTYITPATISDIDPMEVEPKPRKKRKRKKHRSHHSTTPDTHTDTDEHTDKPADKKIIIEDFVEIKPIAAVTRRSVKTRKRTRKTRITTTLPRMADDWDDSMRMEGSMEDSPMMEKEILKNSGPSLRRASSQVPEVQSAPRPVQLMMKSNVTLKLGDEFFAWRKRGQTADDVADILGELIIPESTRGSETETTERETESEKDVLLTGRGVRERSSSEESGGGD